MLNCYDFLIIRGLGEKREIIFIYFDNSFIKEILLFYVMVLTKINNVANFQHLSKWDLVTLKENKIIKSNNDFIIGNFKVSNFLKWDLIKHIRLIREKEIYNKERDIKDNLFSSYKDYTKALLNKDKLLTKCNKAIFQNRLDIYNKFHKSNIKLKAYCEYMIKSEKDFSNNVHKEVFKFEKLKSFYLFLINTKGDIKEEFYTKVYRLMKGKLKPKNKVVSQSRQNKLLEYISKNGVLFVRSGLTKEITQLNDISKLFYNLKDKSLTNSENIFLINSFSDFIKCNKLTKPMQTINKKEKQIIDLVIKPIYNTFKEIVIKNNFKNKNKIYIEFKNKLRLENINGFLNFENLEFLNKWENKKIEFQTKEKLNIWNSEKDYKEYTFLKGFEYTKKVMGINAKLKRIIDLSIDYEPLAIKPKLSKGLILEFVLNKEKSNISNQWEIKTK